MPQLEQRRRADGRRSRSSPLPGPMFGLNIFYEYGGGGGIRSRAVDLVRRIKKIEPKCTSR